MRPRVLIVNADDFGQSPGVNRGVAHAHAHGIVTSASLMVHGAAAHEASALAREHPRLAVGLHFDLGEWYLADGVWIARYQRAPLNDAQAVEAELSRQLEAFQSLMGRAPTHLDAHQHVHLREPVLAVAQSAARALGIPLRRCDRAIRYCGAFYGQGEDGRSCPENVSVDVLVRLLETLPEGVTELCCHPAAAQDLDTMYVAERELELRSLCDPRVRAALERLEIELSSFAAISSRFRAAAA